MHSKSSILSIIDERLYCFISGIVKWRRYTAIVAPHIISLNIVINEFIIGALQPSIILVVLILFATTVVTWRLHFATNQSCSLRSSPDCCIQFHCLVHFTTHCYLDSSIAASLVYWLCYILFMDLVANPFMDLCSVMCQFSCGFMHCDVLILLGICVVWILLWIYAMFDELILLWICALWCVNSFDLWIYALWCANSLVCCNGLHFLADLCTMTCYIILLTCTLSLIHVTFFWPLFLLDCHSLVILRYEIHWPINQIEC